MTIEQLPLEWCFQPGVKLDFRSRPDGYVVTAKDVADELDRIRHALKPLDIVVVNTAAGAKYGQPGYVDAGCGMGREATLYLLEQGVRVVGTDAWSWDAPFSFTRQRLQTVATLGSSGKAIKRAATSATDRWRNCPTSTNFPPTASGSRASHTRSRKARPASSAPSRSWTRDAQAFERPRRVGLIAALRRLQRERLASERSFASLQ